MIWAGNVHKFWSPRYLSELIVVSWIVLLVLDHCTIYSQGLFPAKFECNSVSPGVCYRHVRPFIGKTIQGIRLRSFRSYHAIRRFGIVSEKTSQTNNLKNKMLLFYRAILTGEDCKCQSGSHRKPQFRYNIDYQLDIRQNCHRTKISLQPVQVKKMQFSAYILKKGNKKKIPLKPINSRKSQQKSRLMFHCQLHKSRHFVLQGPQNHDLFYLLMAQNSLYYRISYQLWKHNVNF